MGVNPGDDIQEKLESTLTPSGG